MRALKAIYLSVLFTLAMGLFCGEFPESMRLQDDTTNDFVADSSASAARENDAVRESESVRSQAVNATRTANRMGAAECNEPSHSATKPARVSGKELLPVLSIRRT